MQNSHPLIVAIAGAKGGVGKSMVCSNLAIQFAQAGLKTTLLDLDLGAANQHTLLGVSRSCRGWTQWLVHPSDKLSKFQVHTKQENLSILPANGYRPGVAEISLDLQTKLIDQIRKLDSEIILIDLGAGSHKGTLDFFTLADIKVIVTTTESTSLLNNFEFLKNVLYQAFCRASKNYPDILELVYEFKNDVSLKLSHLIKKVEAKDPFFSETLIDICRSLNVNVVFNQVRKVEEVHKAMRLKKIVQKQLHLDLIYPGFIFFSEEVVASMQKKLPISYISPSSIVTQIFKRITQLLLESSISEKKQPSSLISWSQIQQDFHKNRVERKKAHHLL
ncbi:MAG: Iron-sulfur cluster carrier protein [Chlamydiae bacterium]|nr:Iron-sulfur cluster carrier protein [Chlamydiota bacterium]